MNRITPLPGFLRGQHQVSKIPARFSNYSFSWVLKVFGCFNFKNQRSLSFSSDLVTLNLTSDKKFATFVIFALWKRKACRVKVLFLVPLFESAFRLLKVLDRLINHWNQHKLTEYQNSFPF